MSSPMSLGKCPECRRPSVLAYRPFCSKRCADIDLGRWMSGSYVISGSVDGDEDGEGDLAGAGAAPTAGDTASDD